MSHPDSWFTGCLSTRGPVQDDWDSDKPLIKEVPGSGICSLGVSLPEVGRIVSTFFQNESIARRISKGLPVYKCCLWDAQARAPVFLRRLSGLSPALPALASCWIPEGSSGRASSVPGVLGGVPCDWTKGLKSRTPSHLAYACPPPPPHTHFMPLSSCLELESTVRVMLRRQTLNLRGHTESLALLSFECGKDPYFSSGNLLVASHHGSSPPAPVVPASLVLWGVWQWCCG